MDLNYLLIYIVIRSLSNYFLEQIINMTFGNKEFKMHIIEKYLVKLQKEYGGLYANPIQTRPLPKPGITGEKPEVSTKPGVVGPSGMQVDLDKDERLGDVITRKITEPDTDKET